MSSNFIFRVWLENQAIFESDHGYYINQYVDESHIAAGLFSSDPEGFEAVQNMGLYTKIQKVLEKNVQMELLQIIGQYQNGVIVAMQFAGNYEYFCLQKLKIDDVSDEIAGEMAVGIDLDRESSFEHPYIVTFKNGKVWSVE